MKSEKYTCPECHAKEAVDIVYGYPTDATLKSWQNKEVELGGCVIIGDDPEFRCMKCGHLW
jgi:hypothetical protein